MDTSHDLKIGTCAWTYDDWNGVFYPKTVPSAERLAFYAQHLSAVEVDATFYHTPARHVVEHWAEATPPHFAFTCKLPKEITHELRLHEAGKPLNAFLKSVEPLQEKLWAIVVQLPPSFRIKNDEQALRDFVRHLPSGIQFAIEFRDEGWHMPRIAHLLQEHGVSWAWSDSTPLDHQKEGAFEFTPDTTRFAYVRLMGDLQKKYGSDGKKLHRYRELQWPREAALDSWATRIQQAKETHSRIFVAVSNHFEGYAPETARRLGDRLGLTIRPPTGDEPEGEKQMELL